MTKLLRFISVTLLRIRIVLTRICNKGVYQYQKPNKVKGLFRYGMSHVTIMGVDNVLNMVGPLKGLLNIHIDGNNNTLLFDAPFVTEMTKIKINGSNNTIHFKGEFITEDSWIKIQGDNNIIEIGSSKDASYRIDVYPRLASRCNNARVIIGDHVTTSNQAWLRVGESGSLLQIGSNTMISWDVTIWNTDCHSIFDVEDELKEKPLNLGRKLIVGNRCWIGKGASILKNTELPDNTIVGMGAVVAKAKCEKSYCVLAGNPAKVVREGVKWDIRSPSDFCEVSHAE